MRASATAGSVRPWFARGAVAEQPWGASPTHAAAAIAGVVVAALALGVVALPPRLGVLVLPASALLAISVAVRDARRVLLAVALLDIPLQFDVNFGYRESLALNGALSGFNVSVTTASLILLYALWASELLSRREQTPSRPLLRASMPPLIYLAVVVFSLLVAQNVEVGLYEVLMLAQIFLLFLYIVSTVRTESDVLFVFTMFLVGLIFESLFILAQRYLGPGFHVPGITNRIDPGLAASGVSTRLGGTVGSPNTAASYLALFLCGALGLLIAPVRRGYKLLAGVALILGVTALVHTFSRGAWLGFALSTLVFVTIALGRRLISPVITGAVITLLATAILVAAPLQQAVVGRLTSNDYGSAQSRMPLAQMAKQMIEDHPLFGVGVNNYSLALPQYETPNFANAWHYTVHDKYLLVWAETGVIGLAAFLAFLLTTLRRGWIAIASRDRLLAPLALGLTAGVCGDMTHMIVDIFQGRPQAQALWVVAALLSAIALLSVKRTNERQPS